MGTSLSAAIGENYNEREIAMQDAMEAFKQGLDHVRRSEFEHAVEAFTKAIELDPELAIAYDARGAVFTLMGNTDQGIADCNEAIRLAPKEAKFYRTRCLVFRDVGEQAKAEADLAKSEELGITRD